MGSEGEGKREGVREGEEEGWEMEEECKGERGQGEEREGEREREREVEECMGERGQRRESKLTSILFAAVMRSSQPASMSLTFSTEHPLKLTSRQTT